MSNRLSDAMNKLNVSSNRNSLAQPPASAKRQSGLNQDTINAMFPDAAAAIAIEKAKFTQKTGAQPPSNRNSTVIDHRSSLAATGMSAPGESLDSPSPWNPDQGSSQSKPSGPGQTPMGQFVQPPPSGGGLRSPRPPQLGGGAGPTGIQNTTLNLPDKGGADMPLLSPYAAGSSGNWASMVNTPMVPNFGQNNQADMVANATAMKLAALSTVNNRFALDDVRKFRRARSNDPSGHMPMSPGPHAANFGGANIVMVNEHGQVLNRDQMLALQSQQAMGGFAQQRSRPNSPGIAMHSALSPMGAFASPQANGFLSAYDGQNPLLTGGLGGIGMGQLGLPNEGYLSDHSDMNRGRSPRGRRGSSKPPEDPTDPSLLQDIPAWLRSLRLHKYTDNLKEMNWNDLVELDDKALEDRGVNALGARRKMLKVFEQVRGTSSLQSKVILESFSKSN